MKNDLSFRFHPLIVAVIVVAALFALLFGIFGLVRWTAEGQVLGRVEVADTQLGGLDRDQALVALVALEDRFQGRQVPFGIEGAQVTLNPPEAGFDLDEETIVDTALMVGRQGNIAFQFLWWLEHLFGSVGLPVVGNVDAEALFEVFDRWDRDVIAEPPTLGAIILEDGTPRPVYPEPGKGVDRIPAGEIVLAALLSETEEIREIPTTTIVPRLTRADIDEALAEANQLLSGPIRMVFDGDEIVFTVDQLIRAFVSETIAQSRPRIAHGFDPEIIDTYLTPVRSRFEAEPVDAEFRIEGDEIRIVPGRRGTRIDETETARKLVQAGMTSGRIGLLPLVEDADPDVTTESLEALGIDHLVSSFTTYHSCCENRVVNIQKMADTVDMHIVMPGRTFSLNETVGERTLEKGYLPAGTIIGGQLVDTVGGGVSQFATTMYNAVFWGGYEDVEHKPHSFYFSRYPEGIEATVNWRTPDLIFRNNTSKAIMIDTTHTDTSITVRIFGDNDGRTVKGEQRDGETRIEVVSEGGPDALHVEATVSERYAFTNPPPPRYEPNPSFDVDQRVQKQGERGGWSVTVTRRILRGGSEVVSEEEWIVRYAPQFAVFEVHPCMVPGQEDTCPTTTTTTTTTTTAPPSDDSTTTTAEDST